MFLQMGPYCIIYRHAITNSCQLREKYINITLNRRTQSLDELIVMIWYAKRKRLTGRFFCETEDSLCLDA